MKKLWAGIKKKGFKATLLKIPTRRTPVQIEHNMRSEFERARVIHTLNRTQEFLCTRAEVAAQKLLVEVRVLIRELESYKK